MEGRAKILGRLLVERGSLSEGALRSALKEQETSGRRLGEVLVDRGAVDEATVARALAIQLGLPFAEAPLRPSPDAISLIRPELARRRRVLPLSATARSLRIAMADPLDLSAVDDLQFQSGRRVEPRVAAPGAITRGLAEAYGGELTDLLRQLPSELSRDEEDREALEAAARAAPVVRLVDHLLQRAVEEGASDVHVEHRPDGLRVRYRIDGLLTEGFSLPPGSRGAVLSRIKVMGGMDISVKRRPQDGSFPLRSEGRDLTVRVSTLPVLDGEKAVLRVLDPRQAPRNLEALGLSPADLRQIRGMLAGSQGVLLATGPTGSGKSSTLRAALGELNLGGQNIVSLEDPAEYRLPGVNQVQVDVRAGLGFPQALRSVLRQDPDVILVGEIRDGETAEIAMAAAVTGHLVLSTLHTVDAPGAVARLLEMGVPPYLVAGGLTGVVAQRLVRSLCPGCGGRSPGGCGRCTEGYRGRTGVFQVLLVTDPLREEIVREASLSVLRRLARDGGMRTLTEDARRKVAEGLTTPHEAGRVIRKDAGAFLPCSSCEGDVPAGALGCPRCGLPRLRRCRCGEVTRPGWRYCPSCLRPVRG